MLKVLFLILLSFSSLQADTSSSNKSQGSQTYTELLAQKDDHTGSSKFMEEMVNMFIVLGGIVGVMILVSWVLKKVLNTKMIQINQTSGIKIIERRSLSPKVQIYLLEIRGKGFVIAESPQGVHGLGEFPIIDEEEEIKEDELKSLSPSKSEKIYENG